MPRGRVLHLHLGGVPKFLVFPPRGVEEVSFQDRTAMTWPTWGWAKAVGVSLGRRYTRWFLASYRRVYPVFTRLIERFYYHATLGLYLHCIHMVNSQWHSELDGPVITPPVGHPAASKSDSIAHSNPQMHILRLPHTRRVPCDTIRYDTYICPIPLEDADATQYSGQDRASIRRIDVDDIPIFLFDILPSSRLPQRPRFPRDAEDLKRRDAGAIILLLFWRISSIAYTHPSLHP
ncbi:hypothetical protein B0H16DRAFT_1883946 [Mycena metata]|uniref:Uncharacterized protein n=1 Tax=Mycena metata TaxID=1033252 RepID=A0AAD7JH17_9AGAR|nr:hypothetical protein B0H16DRAFT_1883946 [Mycena metata]